MPNRFTLLDPLAENWSGKFSPQRLAFFERHTRDFTDAELVAGVAHAIGSLEYSPVVAQLRASCFKARAEADRKGRGQRSLRPGGPVPGRPGERFLTSEEALSELGRMKREHPKAFDERIRPRRQGKTFDAINVHRIYINALRRCVKLDGKALPSAAQVRLF